MKLEHFSFQASSVIVIQCERVYAWDIIDYIASRILYQSEANPHIVY